MQKEIQKQMAVMVAVPVQKEGKRMEGTLFFVVEKDILERASFSEGHLFICLFIAIGE